MSEDCLFCKIVAGDLPSDKVYEDEHIYAFRDINPAAPTHVLIVPREHRASLDDTTEGDVELLGHIMLTARKIAAQENLVNGYRVLTNIGPDAGQVVFHMHVHVMGGHKLKAGLG